MLDKQIEGRFIEDLGVVETTETDNVLRWDGERLYVEHDIYHNGQLVHRKYKRNVSRAVAKHVLSLAREVGGSN
ncbi:hypothetical protein [Chelatococcus reniformis]|uniref:Uncharacterized protein n=1 Tax=Chelatococcus reniformis TaxID=1494448 RepID=A0A916XEF2_9HYPH|nr:hypothetical protein [Chelatococcus reniformis]GGC67448.1 hypothetical protein GCM10010994_27580 [Chelatococcus reniformis]